MVNDLDVEQVDQLETWDLVKAGIVTNLFCYVGCIFTNNINSILSV